MKHVVSSWAVASILLSCSGQDGARPLAAAQISEDEINSRRLERHAKDTGLLHDSDLQERVRAATRDIVAQAAMDAALAEATTDARIRAAYTERKESLTAAEVHVAQIVLGPGVDGATVLSRLRAGEAFDVVARDVSADAASAAKGGLLPTLREGQVSTAFFDAARRLEDGEVSDVVTIGAQRHILKAVAPMSWWTPTFEEARPKLTADLMRERRASLLQELRERYPEVTGEP